ncbi:MAG: putative PLP-dependent enzyme involved in cell wall biosis [Marmoricola sp.]|nr:putative PLP-dependent enzyme involved in cell wall biosis [Marmoricola sp.]
MLPYGRQSIDEDDVAAVVEVLRGDWLTTGPAVDRFEQGLAASAGVPHAVAVSSGTAALHTAYACLGLRPGDEVVTTPLTFVATAACATQVGARVVFADVDPDTGLLDPEAVASTVTPRTRVVAAVDYAGQPADHDRLAEVAHAAGALLLADAAHSFGGTYRGRPVGSLADVTTLSFFPTKNLTTAEGGAVVTADAALAQRCREFRTVGLVRDPARFVTTTEGGWHQEVHAFGLNYRLSDLGAALGCSQLARLPAFVDRRRAIFERYVARLADLERRGAVRLPTRCEDRDPAWHLFPLRVREGRRREVYDGMRARGTGVQVNYLPVHRHPAYADLGHRPGECPNAEAYYAEELSLPMFPDLEDDDVDRVCDQLEEVLR